MVMTTERRLVEFVVLGIAQPKGSTRAFLPHGHTRPIITSDNPRVKGWQQLVAEQAQSVADGQLFAGAVSLAVTFHLPRPKSMPRHRHHHTTKPDLDKLVRATKDALKGILYRDDAQVVDLDAHKVYAPIASAPRACITVAEVLDPSALRFGL